MVRGTLKALKSVVFLLILFNVGLKAFKSCQYIQVICTFYAFFLCDAYFCQSSFIILDTRIHRSSLGYIYVYCVLSSYVIVILVFVFFLRCWGSMTCWYGSGSADPYN